MLSRSRRTRTKPSARNLAMCCDSADELSPSCSRSASAGNSRSSTRCMINRRRALAIAVTNLAASLALVPIRFTRAPAERSSATDMPMSRRRAPVFEPCSHAIGVRRGARGGLPERCFIAVRVRAGRLAHEMLVDVPLPTGVLPTGVPLGRRGQGSLGSRLFYIGLR